MAADLLESSPVFRSAVEACARALKPKGVNLMAEFSRPEGWATPALAMAGLSATQVHSPLGLGSRVSKNPGWLDTRMPVKRLHPRCCRCCNGSLKQWCM